MDQNSSGFPSLSDKHGLPKAVFRVPRSVTEGNDGTALLRFPVTLDAPVDVNVSVDYTTQDGTASAGDYVAVTTPATFTINAGDTSGTVNITVNGDKTIEPEETLNLILSNLQARGRNVTLASAEWSQRGQDIDGEASVDLSGWSVLLSGDGNTLAVGAIHNDGSTLPLSLSDTDPPNSSKRPSPSMFWPS